ncbi:Interleukin enhancer-binding factor 3, partial [Biomphalaria glabrata]
KHSVDYELVDEEAPNQQYVMVCKVQGMSFKGLGKSKKVARARAAELALVELYNIIYDP